MSYAFETDDGEQPPTPPRPRSSNAAIVLAVLAVAYTLYMAQDLLLPVLLAAFFALVGNPIIRLLKKLWIPRFIAAILVLVGVKMLLLDVWKVPIWLSLTLIATILAAAVVLSLRATRRGAGEGREPVEGSADGRDPHGAGPVVR